VIVNKGVRLSVTIKTDVNNSYPRRPTGYRHEFSFYETRVVRPFLFSRLRARLSFLSLSLSLLVHVHRYHTLTSIQTPLPQAHADTSEPRRHLGSAPPCRSHHLRPIEHHHVERLGTTATSASLDPPCVVPKPLVASLASI
jgi:hypothetical protein